MIKLIELISTHQQHMSVRAFPEGLTKAGRTTPRRSSQPGKISLSASRPTVGAVPLHPEYNAG